MTQFILFCSRHSRCRESSAGLLWERQGMQQNTRQYRRAVFALLVLLWSVGRSEAQTEPKPSPPLRDLKVTDIFVPRELGQIAQVHEAVAPHPSHKLLLVIQDAHVNYEAQKHLAEMLDRFVSLYGVKLVLVEGGEGDASLSYLRDLGSKATREKVADQYLRDGILSGEEYLDLTSDHALMLWGIDAPTLYDAHMAALLDVERIQEAAKPPLVQLRQLVEQVRATFPNEPLRQFEAARAAFDAGQLGVSAYLDQLIAQCARLGIELTGSPHLQRVVAARALEEHLKPERIAEEQRQAVGRLQRRTAQRDLQQLKDLADRLGAKQVEPWAFYRKLDTLLRQAAMSTEDFPHLSEYLHYLDLKASFQPRLLWSELHELRDRVKSRLIQSPTEAQVTAMADRVRLYERLLEMAWTPEEYRRYRAHEAPIRLSEWVPALQTLGSRLGVDTAWPVDAQALEAQLTSAARFYDVAYVRDEELMRRALEKMDDEGERVAVLIVGGFHTDNLVDRLSKTPMDVIVITPVVSADTNQAHYLQVLKSKHRAWQRQRERAAR